MSKFIPIILASGLVSFIATPLMRRLAQAIDFVDRPASRKLHSNPVPMLGGVAIYVGLVAAVVMTDTRPYQEMMGVLGGATVVTLFGLWDDRFEMKPLIKLAGQTIAALILILSGVQVTIFSSQILNVGLTWFWILGICNAINFLDNMDGLAAGIAAVASGFFLVLAVVEGLGLVASLAAAMVGACVGFLYHNFNPARLFMGDAGSLLLGFVLAVLGIKLEFVGRPLDVTWMIPIIILGLPIFDTTLVVISRLRRGKPVYQGGKDHTSHRLVSVLGMDPSRSVMTLYLIAAVLGLVALMLRDATPFQARLILFILAALFVVSLVWLEARFKGPASPATDASVH
ncbi:MAG TPA: undecaprenyl/decaprenyl-phosphate alpha-N-acetylglucosaminyl 1-phosphate transferase [Chloroflexi bacterium]|nr:undecaprenyl/decaprenyl-phosphate alpha-N-acetylglucosaminyl 1-phosphate transferase [Chloroflexota bacterium]